MNLLEVLLLGIGLAMDAFAVSIGKGLSLRSGSMKYGLICGLWFGAFQALMPLIGYFAGSRFIDIIGGIDHWIVFILLVLIGGNMIREARGDDDQDADPSFGPLTMLALAIATSIDALAAGISFALMDVQIAVAVTIIGVTTFIISFAGVRIGNIFGAKYQTGARIAGGVVLIAIGLKVLLESLLA